MKNTIRIRKDLPYPLWRMLKVGCMGNRATAFLSIVTCSNQKVLSKTTGGMVRGEQGRCSCGSFVQQANNLAFESYKG